MTTLMMDLTIFVNHNYTLGKALINCIFKNRLHFEGAVKFNIIYYLYISYIFNTSNALFFNISKGFLKLRFKNCFNDYLGRYQENYNYHLLGIVKI